MTRLYDILFAIVYTMLFVGLVVLFQSCDRSSPPPKPAPNASVLVVVCGGLGSDQTRQLAEELELRCGRALVYSVGSWDAYKLPIAPVVVGYPAKQVVLVGHSKAAWACVKAAAELETMGRAVDLLIIIDGVSVGNFSLTIPGNVRHCIAFYAGIPTPFIWRATLYGPHDTIIVPRVTHNALPFTTDVTDRIAREIATF